MLEAWPDAASLNFAVFGFVALGILGSGLAHAGTWEFRSSSEIEISGLSWSPGLLGVPKRQRCLGEVREGKLRSRTLQVQLDKALTGFC